MALGLLVLHGIMTDATSALLSNKKKCLQDCTTATLSTVRWVAQDVTLTQGKYRENPGTRTKKDGTQPYYCPGTIPSGVYSTWKLNGYKYIVPRTEMPTRGVIIKIFYQ